MIRRGGGDSIRWTPRCPVGLVEMVNLVSRHSLAFRVELFILDRRQHSERVVPVSAVVEDFRCAPRARVDTYLSC